MRAVIISGGRISDYEFIKAQIKDSDTIICADSGYNHAVKMNLQVSAVVGDFDSIGIIPDDIPTMRSPAKKDFTDTELAIEYARAEGFRDFLLLAALGSRTDHSLANILLMKEIADRGENAMIVDEHNKIMMTNSALSFSEPKASIVSLIPLSDCYGVSTENLEYSLHNAALLMGKGLGVSNIMAADHACVSVQKGLLLVIVARD